MKDSEFITLLNLYLDHEISPEDSARLEAAVAGDPVRRRIYRQYCQIQKACAVLAQEERSAAPEEASVFEASVRRSPKVATAAIWLGGLAAAAGLALVLALNAGHPAAPAIHSAPAVAVVEPATQPALATQPAFTLHVQQPSSAGGLATDMTWMRAVQFAPLKQISADKLLALDSKQTTGTETQAVADKPTSQDAVNTTAFQFQR